MHRQLTRAALTLVAATIFGACSSAPVQVNMTCTPPACTPAQNTYGAEINGVDSTGSSFPATEFNALVADSATGAFIISLPAPALVQGAVTSNGSPVPGTVIFTRPSRIPGRPNVFYQATIDPMSGAYSISVPPSQGDEQYTVRVQPMDTSLYPPTSISEPVLGSMNLDVELPSGTKLIRVHGTLVDVVNMGVGGAQVVVRDSVTQSSLSTVAQTDAFGHFTLQLPNDAITSSALVLAVERGDEMTGLESLSIQLTPVTISTQQLEQALMVQLPALPPATHLSYSVVGAATNGGDEPVAGAHFVLQTVLLDYALGTTIARHEVKGETDAYGNLTVDLYSNTMGARQYQISISPPADSEFQTLKTSVTVGTATGFSGTLKLPVRPLVTGQIVDLGGAAQKGAVVQPTLSPIAASAASSSVMTSSSAASGVTDGTGRFALRMDPGTYDFGIVPPATSQLPHLWINRRDVEADLDLGRFALPAPVTIDGVVLGPDQLGVQATLRIYSVPAGNGACAASAVGCLAPPRLEAEGMTDMNGRVPLLLPADGN